MAEKKWNEDLIGKVHGDFVGEDKITVGDVGSSGSTIAIGRGAESTVQEGLGRDSVNKLFESFYQAINKLQEPFPDKTSLVSTVRKIQWEVIRGKEANEFNLSNLFVKLESESRKFFNLIADSLTDPAGGFAPNIHMAVRQAKSVIAASEDGLEGGFDTITTMINSSDLTEPGKKEIDTKLKWLRTEIDRGAEVDLSLFRSILDEATFTLPDLHEPLLKWLMGIDKLPMPMKFVAEELLASRKYK